VTLHGSLRRAAVLGHPVGHSLSPLLHRAAYAHLGLDWTYEAIDVAADDLRDFVQSCGPEWVGLSLTMPLKQVVLPLLDDADETVRLVGAANTLIWRDGRRVGANTDVPGLVGALREAGLPSAERAVVLGAGATAASALAALAELGVGEVGVYARRPEAADPLRQLAARLGLDVRVDTWAHAADALDAPLVLSTVPAGGADALASAVDHPTGLLFDVVYASWPTPLARTWQEAGGAVASGLDLLVHQAIGQIELMTGRAVAVGVLRAALQVPG
jgi:shikimate dehydrogenase